MKRCLLLMVVILATANLLLAQDTIVSNVSVSHETCPGLCDGSISLYPLGGIAPYYYIWSNGDTTQTINNLCPGTYNATVSDDTNNQLVFNPFYIPPPVNQPSSHQFLITAASQDSASIQSSDYLAAYYLSAGVYTCGGYAGCNPLSLLSITLWQDEPATSYKEGFEVGEEIVWKIFRPYSPVVDVMATYSSAYMSQGVFVPNGMSLVEDLDIYTNCLELSIEVLPADPLQIVADITPIDLAYSTPGSISTQVTGGINPYSFLWSTGATSSGIDSLEVGLYGLTVSDSVGCDYSEEYFIGYDTVPVFINLWVGQIVCHGDNNGAAVIDSLVGVPPISILWSTGATSHTIQNLAPGNYGVTVSASDSSNASEQFSIFDPYPITMDLEISPEYYSLGDPITISIILNGGVPPYFYQWSTGATIDSISAYASGYYGITVNDAHGCTHEYSWWFPESVATVLDGNTTIFPNPVIDELTINIESNTGLLGVELFTLRGEKINMNNLEENFRAGKLILDCSHLQPGLFLLMVKAGDKVQVEKIIKI